MDTGKTVESGAWRNNRYFNAWLWQLLLGRTNSLPFTFSDMWRKLAGLILSPCMNLPRQASSSSQFAFHFVFFVRHRFSSKWNCSYLCWKLTERIKGYRVKGENEREKRESRTNLRSLVGFLSLIFWEVGVFLGFFVGNFMMLGRESLSLCWRHKSHNSAMADSLIHLVIKTTYNII